MLSLAQRLIKECHESPIPTGVPRGIRIPDVAGSASVVTGVRGAGKSFVLFEEMQHLVDQGVPRSRLLHVDFEDDRLQGIELPDLRFFPEAFFRFHPENRDVRSFFFFEGMERVQGWEGFIRRLLDEERARVVVSGSSARLLGREIGAALRGRTTETLLQPLSFAEFLTFQGVAPPADVDAVAKALRSRLENLAERYLHVGGFPAVVALSPRDRRRVLQGTVRALMLKDIVEPCGAGNLALLASLVRELLSSPGYSFSGNQFSREAIARGLKCGKNTVFEYARRLADAFLIVPVRLLADSERRRNANPTRFYPIDTGLAGSYEMTREVPLQRLLETAGLLELRGRQGTVHYVKTGNGLHVDFCAEEESGRPGLVQVCAAPDVRASADYARNALLAALADFKLSTGTVVTLATEETEKAGAHVIEWVPAWRWLLRGRRRP